MDVRLNLPDSARKPLKKAAKERYLTTKAYIRSIVADKVRELNNTEAE